MIIVRSIGFTGTQGGVSGERLARLSNVLLDLKYAGAKVFHHGDCVGADEQAHERAFRLLYEVHIHPPVIETKRAFCKWSRVHESLPYLQRNKVIVNSCDVLIAMPKDIDQEELRSGTWSTVRYARKQKKQIIMI